MGTQPFQRYRTLQSRQSRDRDVDRSKLDWFLDARRIEGEASIKPMRKCDHHGSSTDLLRHLTHNYASGQAYNQALALTYLGDAYRTAGDLAAACQCWPLGLTILDDLHHPDAAEIRARLDHARPGGRTEPTRMSRRLS